MDAEWAFWASAGECVCPIFYSRISLCDTLSYFGEKKVEVLNNYIGQISLLVRDYDEAIAYYSAVLGFCLIEDTVLSDTKRWVVMSNNRSAEKDCRILLAKASNSVQEGFVGNQSGGRVFLFLYTDSFDDFHRNLLNHKVEIVNGPREEAYGRVLVFKDLYGNLWDLIST